MQRLLVASAGFPYLGKERRINNEWNITKRHNNRRESLCCSKARPTNRKINRGDRKENTNQLSDASPWNQGHARRWGRGKSQIDPYSTDPIAAQR